MYHSGKELTTVVTAVHYSIHVYKAAHPAVQKVIKISAI